MSSPSIERAFGPLTVADLFCGAGGISEGLRHTRWPDGTPGFDVVFGIDNNLDAIRTYRANIFRSIPDIDQLQRAPNASVIDLDAKAILSSANVDRIDVLVGGPNCQAVSSAGRRNLEDKRNAGFNEYVRLVEELQPRWFLMENVPGLTHRTGQPLLSEIFDRLAAIPGYAVSGDVLLAADHGAPQFRYRLFLVGTRTGLPIRFPIPTHGPNRPLPFRTVRDAIGNASREDPESWTLTPRTKQRIESVPPGGDWRDIPIRLLPERSFSVRTSDQKGVYGRLRWDEPSFTITGLAGNVTAGPFTHPELNRPISTYEAARLQGFSEEYRFQGARESRFQQIGNAVPPPLAAAIGEQILRIESAEDCGVEGRLTPATIQRVVRGEARLPVLTPRLSTKPKSRRVGPPGGKLAASSQSEAVASAATSNPMPSDLIRLQAESQLPAYTWTHRRSRIILGSLTGRTPEDLGAELKVSPEAAARWIQEFRSIGPEGWRAYHTPLASIAAGDGKTAALLEAAVARVRRPTLVSDVREGKARADINPHLRRLIRRWGHLSVDQLKARLARAGYPTGTAYVGDLLAIAECLLGSASEDDMRMAVGGVE